MTKPEDDAPSTAKLVAHVLGQPEFRIGDTQRRTYDVHSLTVDDARVRTAIRDYFASIDHDDNSPLRQGKQYRIAEREVHYVNQPMSEAQFALEQPSVLEYVRYHVLGQRIAEAQGARSPIPPEFAMDDEREPQGANFLKCADGTQAKSLRAVLETMLKDEGAYSKDAIRQVAEIQTHDATILSTSLPAKYRPLLGLKEEALVALSRMEDARFFSAFDRANEAANAKGKPR